MGLEPRCLPPNPGPLFLLRSSQVYLGSSSRKRSVGMGRGGMWGWDWASRHVGELHLWSPGQGEDKTSPPPPRRLPPRGIQAEV